MNKLKWIAIFVWGAVFLVGLLVLVWRAILPEPAAVAAKEMPANHLIQAADLESRGNKDRFVGKYLRRHVMKNETFTTQDVLPTPLLSLEQAPLFAIATPAGDAGKDVEAQKTGAICRDTKVVAAAEAVAILCAPKEEGGACLAVLRAAPEEMKKLAEGLAKDGPANLWFKAACSK